MYILIFVVQVWTWVTRRVSLKKQELLTVPGHPSSHPVFNDIRIAQSFVFCIVFSEPFFVFLSFFFWQLYRLSFVDLRLDCPFVSFLVKFVITRQVCKLKLETSPRFLVGFVLLIFLVLRFKLCLSSFCALYPTLSTCMSLDCPYLITPFGIL